MFYFDIIRKLQNLSSSPSDIKIKNIFGGPLQGNEKIVHINVQYSDCTETVENRVENFVCENCKSAEIYSNDNLVKDIYTLLNELDHKGGSIEINLYEKGTQIGFLYAEEPTFLESERLEVVTPGISSEILEIGKKYFIMDLKEPNLSKKETLTKIERKMKFGFILHFDSGRTLEVLTRGHVCEPVSIVNRLDYHIISREKRPIKDSIISYLDQNIDFLQRKEIKNLVKIANKIN